MRCSGTVLEYLRWIRVVMQHDEQIYSDVNVALMEGLLRLEPNKFESSQVRSLAATFLSGKSTVAGVAECQTLAPLLVLRFGDKRSLPLLKRCFDDKSFSAPLLRAAAVVYSSYGDKEFGEVRRSASRLMRNPLADIVKLVERIRKYPDVPVRYKARLRPRYDPVARALYVDGRALLTVRLLKLARAPQVIRWVADWKTNVVSQPISSYDRQLVRRLL
jgi:hypothetical protein